MAFSVREREEVIRPVIESSGVVVSVFGLIKAIEHAFSFTLCKHGARHRLKTKETR